MAGLFPDTPAPIRHAELIREAEREVEMRLSVYPGRVRAGRLSQAMADRKTECMRMIVRILKGEQDVARN